MKKISEERCRFLRNRQKKQTKKLLKIARRLAYLHRIRRLKSRVKKNHWLKLKAPAVFQLSKRETRNEILDFLKSTSSKLKSGRNVEICLAETKTLHPCGTLIFKAHLDSWRTKFKSQIKLTYPTDSKIHELFQHIGLFEDFEMYKRVEITSDNVKHWKHFVGTRIEAGVYKDLTLDVVSHIEHPESHRFGGCLDEAVSNCVNHAYKGTSKAGNERGSWWMFSSPKESGLFVAIYDIGIGIPSSLKMDPDWKFLWLRNTNDAKAIKAAVETERSSTKLPHRGKGLPEMLEFCRSLNTGELVILSGKGGVLYNCNKEEKPKLFKFKVKLPGTLVLWSLPLKVSVP